MHADILIIGAGLAGLSLAERLHREGQNALVLEARHRIGGRVLPLDHAGEAYDLGPAWFWPGQPRMATAARAYDLTIFEQYAQGKLVFQDRSGAIRRDLDLSPMAGALRIAGGVTTLLHRIAEGLPEQSVRTAHQLIGLQRNDDGIAAQVRTPDAIRTVQCTRCVLAMPPRVIADSIAFSPKLDDAAHSALARIPTWMAGHAKLLAVYADPFWRDQGMSVDAISHLGPLAEIHDASPLDADHGALFGFAGTPASGRTDAQAVKRAALDQLETLFGPKAADPVSVVLQDWAYEPFTATAADHDPPATHPAYGTPVILRNLWDGHLHIASSEMGETFGGFLEGALEAAEQTASTLLANRV